MSAESIEKIEKITKSISSDEVNSVKSIETTPSTVPNKESFDRLMAEEYQKQDKLEVEKVQASKKLNPMEEIESAQRRANATKDGAEKANVASQEYQKQDKLEVEKSQASRKLNPMEEAERIQRRVSSSKDGSAHSLIAQAEDAIKRIDDARTKLSSPNLELKGSVQTVLRNKLSHIDESLKIALSKVGVDYAPPTETNGLMSPLQKFVGYLTHGQSQLENLSNTLSALPKDQFSPGVLLTLQLKVGFIQQELEFFVSLLNKTLESTKTLMNVQV